MFKYPDIKKRPCTIIGQCSIDEIVTTTTVKINTNNEIDMNPNIDGSQYATNNVNDYFCDNEHEIKRLLYKALGYSPEDIVTILETS